MKILGHILLKLGTLGPTLLVVSLILGACSEHVASAARSFLPLSAFLLTLGSFLAADLAPTEQTIHRSKLFVSICWIGVGVPLLVAVPVYFLGLGPPLRSAILLSVIAPPVGSAAALATMLGLRPRLALLASIALTVAAPGVMPMLVTILHAGVTLDLPRLISRLILIIGCAVLLAAVVRRRRHLFRTVLPNAQAAAGVAVIGLVIVGLATVHGAWSQAGHDNFQFLRFMLAAVAINIGIASIGVFLFFPWGLKEALTIGLVAGNRNVTLAWAAASASLPSQGEAYIAACVIPVLSLPLVIKILFSLHRSWSLRFRCA